MGVVDPGKELMSSKKKKKKFDPSPAGAQNVAQKAGASRPDTRESAPKFPLETIPVWAKLTVAVVILVVAICVLYPHHVFENKVFLAGDVEAAGSFATPIKKEMAETQGYPLWNPYLFAGMPSYESLSYNPNVYPISVVTGFLSNYLHFPNATWLLFHVFLLGFGVFLLLYDRGVNFMVAAAAGVLMMWMPNQVAVGAYGHGTQANAVAYIPFALFFWDRIWRGKSLLVNASALVIVLGFQLLRAHIQISYYTFALIGLYTLFFGVLRIRDALKGTGDPEYPATLGFFKRVLRREGVAKKRLAMIETSDLVVVLGLVVVGALFISAVLFLPVKDYSPQSIRGASETGGVEYDYATSWSLHPVESLTFVFPFSFGFGRATYHGHLPFTDYANYLGLVVIIFSVFAVTLARNRFVWFLVVVIAIATLVSFGKFLPVLYGPLFKWFPYFNKFRVPVMILIVQQFAFVLLFGLGLSAVVRSRSDIVKKAAFFGMIGGGVALIVALLSSSYWEKGFAQAIAPGITAVRTPAEQLQLAKLSGSLLFADLVKFSVLLLFTFGTIWLFARRNLRAEVFVVIAVLLAMIDIFAVDSFVLNPGKLYPEAMRRGGRLEIIKDKSVRDRFLEPDDVITFLNSRKGADRFRVFPAFHPSAPLRGGDFATNRYMNFGISSIGGYHAAKLSLYNDFVDALGVALQNGKYQLVDMMNARYVVTSHPFPEVPSFRLLWQGENFRGQRRHIYENAGAFPRVFLVDKYLVGGSKEILGMLPALPANGVDLRETVLLETEPPVRPESASGARAAITGYSFNEIRVDATLPSAAILVLSEVYYPRWTAFVDGVETELLKANYVLRAVALSAGEHEIVFRYDSKVLKRGLIISVITFATALIVLMLSAAADLRRNPIWKR